MNTRVGVTPGACPLRASLWPYSYYNSGRAGGEIGPNFGFITKGDDNDGELQFSCAWSPRWMGQRDAMGGGVSVTCTVIVGLRETVS